MTTDWNAAWPDDEKPPVVDPPPLKKEPLVTRGEDARIFSLQRTPEPEPGRATAAEEALLPHGGLETPEPPDVALLLVPRELLDEVRRRLSPLAVKQAAGAAGIQAMTVPAARVFEVAEAAPEPPGTQARKGA